MAKGSSRPIVVGPDGEPVAPMRPWRLILAAALIFLIFLVCHDGAPLYCDWLWFHEVGYTSVFATIVAAKSGLYVAAALVFFVAFYGSLRIAAGVTPDAVQRMMAGRIGVQAARAIQRWIGVILFVAAAFLSLWAGRLASESWSSWLEFTHPSSFGVRDPVFGIDVAFYVFQLPFLHALWAFAMGTLVLSLIAAGVYHFASRAVESLGGLSQAPPAVRAQLLVLAALIALTQAFGTHLGGYDLLTSDNGKFVGAGFADTHYRLLAVHIQTILLIVTAVACFVPIWRGAGYRWPLIAGGAWLAAVLLLGYVLPGVVQKASVEPNEFSMEREYIRRNIEFTRRGFNLQSVQRVDDFPADQSLDAAGIARNRDTIENVRLWDHPYLSKVYSQLETVKNYYKFERVGVNGQRTNNIDVDRYRVGGKLRQVMLGAREMDTSGLPEFAQSWQNQRLTYTHGYGVVMSPVNKTIQGLPDYFLSGIPVRTSPSAPGIRVTEPRIYYGQIEHGYVFADTEQTEFDYPSTGSGAADAQDHTVRYSGRGGIPIGASALARWAFSITLGDPNLLLTRSFGSAARLLYRRDIRDRIQTIAPFVQQDGDPYLVVDPDTGRLIWIVDCYTLSDQLPYATPQRMDVSSQTYIAPNYVRNSIKATVDAYDGSVRLYVSDPGDPIARTYGRIFPGLLQPLDRMPSGLRDHIRYPEDLFRLQRTVYAAYHVDDPRIFYFREDSWAIPTEPNADPGAAQSGGARDMEPYYVIMRLPDVSKTKNNSEEFLLMSPLAPAKREAQNILGWMCARCDAAHYGELVLYRFPQQVSVNGPSQVIAFVNNDPSISARLTPLRLGGSTATFGNLLVIPVENSLLYIAPLYVESTSGATSLPKLQKVVVAFGESVAMEDTLPAALADLFPTGGAPAVPPPRSGTPVAPIPGGGDAVSPQIRASVLRLSDQYDAAQRKLKTGDLGGYAADMKGVEQTLQTLRKQAGAAAK
ncbi:MAG TPA: UPF0182 family protein [Chthonomonadaceae bacterium]|nr:UPF0182 family protein [Chthonomonadaceae bacterium]